MTGQFCLPVWAGAGIAAAAAISAAILWNAYRKLRQQAANVGRLLVEAQAGSRQKSEFLANMSHEIRTPMNGILGLIELTLGTELSVVQREYLTAVNESANSLLGIINEILDCSRIEAGRLQLESAEFGLHRLITDAVRAFSFQAHEKNLELLYFVAGDVPDRAMGDATRLRQVLVNLLGNAVKFTRRGEVELRCEVAFLDRKDLHLRFSVRDTGIGIPEAKQKEIFDAFSQADASVTREFGGTGLGLTISSQIVQMMGGEIEVESKPGSGSTFRFTVGLRCVAEGPSAVESAAVYGPVLGGKRLLLVDDNAASRKNLEASLGAAAVRITQAASAAEALAALADAERDRDAFDLVVVDSDMPQIDGFELVRHMQAAAAASQPAIMLLTAKNLNEHVEQCRALGITFLLKPVSSERLLQTAADLVANRKPAAAPAAVATSLPEVKPAAPVYGGLQILLAEDNVVNQKIVLEMLKRANCQVHVVANGAEALASWKHQSYDLILMDMQMPRMDGTEATTRIREAERSGRTRIPILALTANAREEDRQRCLAAGMDDYLSKPFKSDQLMEKVHRLTAASAQRTA